ncbi:MAG: peptidoglycan-binding protein [Proteobacteria bacterium]|nr:peptidoglycan-binding protein [Pseudomonadota bacterium]
MERTIPCDDCAERTLDIQQLGFRVTGCNPHPNRPGSCVLTFVESAAPQMTLAAAGEMVAAIASPGDLTGGVGNITATQAAVAKAIVNLFETGEVLGEYGKVTLIAGDTGHLTFGRSQTTLGSGNLAQLLQKYCANQGARFAGRLAPFLPRFTAIDHTLDDDHTLHNVLRASADDPVMRDTQDAFFDKTYWQPAVRAAGKLGLRSPLALAVVYDSFVHGSWSVMRDRTTHSVGAPAAIGERAWISAYVATRRDWLENHARSDLRLTVYRMDAFKRLIDQGFWGLELPLVVRGKEISPLTLAAIPPGCYDGPQPGSRLLTLLAPLVRGLDVRLLQLGLSDRGVDIQADGIFGQTTSNLVKTWQAQNGRPVNGIADRALIGELTA